MSITSSVWVCPWLWDTTTSNERQLSIARRVHVTDKSLHERSDMKSTSSLVPFLWGFEPGIWGWGRNYGGHSFFRNGSDHSSILNFFLFLFYFSDRVSLSREKTQTRDPLALASSVLSWQVWSTMPGSGWSLHLDWGGVFKSAYSLKMVSMY